MINEDVITGDQDEEGCKSCVGYAVVNFTAHIL